MTVRLRKPKKSILSRPSSSIVVIVNCVAGPLSDRYSGTYSSIGALEITTPAAWVDAWRGMPSIALAISMTSRVSTSDSYISASSGLVASALSIVMPSSKGIALAIWSVLA